jgi:methyl-accepting chemotaxis protein
MELAERLSAAIEEIERLVQELREKTAEVMRDDS